MEWRRTGDDDEFELELTRGANDAAFCILCKAFDAFLEVDGVLGLVWTGHWDRISTGVLGTLAVQDRAR